MRPMHPLVLPHLPQAAVGAVLLNPQSGDTVRDRLIRQFHTAILPVPLHPELPQATGSHADLQFFHLGGGSAVCSREIFRDPDLRRRLAALGFRLLPAREPLGHTYPFDIALDAARIGNRLFCVPGRTDVQIMEYCRQNDIAVLAVRQGYAKCSICAVDENSLITADRGIAEAAEKDDMDVCRIRPGHIYLDGRHDGFIGGAAGKLGSNRMGIIGQLSSHPDGQIIRRFLYRHGVRISELDTGPLRDIGGLLPLTELESRT